MISEPTLLIGRCSFWPEARDPEAWLRALVALAGAAEKSGTQSWTSPRALANTVLRGHLSRRGVPGLFGLEIPRPRERERVAEGRVRAEGEAPASDADVAPHAPILLGVGLLELSAPSDSQPSTLNPQPSWQLSQEAQSLLATWQTADHRQALEQLALSLLRRSVWLRLALLKFRAGTWRLRHWATLKASNAQLAVGKALLLGPDAAPTAWLSGIEESALGAWWPELSPELLAAVQVHAPQTAKPEDGLSLAPLKSPLYLLDSLGWLEPTGGLRLPASLTLEPLLSTLQDSKPSPAALLDQLVAAFADHRGVFPLEPVMLRFARASGVFPHPAANEPDFIAWTDRLLSESLRTGAIELFSAEPGQPRHGRGLLGDSTRKLLRWRVHPGFDELHLSLSSLFTPQSAPISTP